MKFTPKKLENLFSETFYSTHKTRLQFGAPEPFYEASDSQDGDHIIHCRQDYVRSALHEVAHWCVAGEKRRQVDDYGYWYRPDGRNKNEQIEFEKVESKPQAIEKAFCQICDIEFSPSMDNLQIANLDDSNFRNAIENQLENYRQMGFPKRAQRFMEALSSLK